MMNQDKQKEERAAFEAWFDGFRHGWKTERDVALAAWQARAALSSRPVQGGDVNIDALIDPDFAGPAEIFEPDTPVVCRSEVYAAIKKLMAPDSFTGFTKEQASAWISHQAREIERLRAEVASQSRRIHNQRAEISRLSSAPAQPVREPMSVERESDRQLMDFYSVDTLPDLIDAQARHIERLQDKLPQLDPPAFTRVREG